MEVAHARLSSLPRNFVVKYADDVSFDYKNYKPIDENAAKHSFFEVIDRKNDRMQHLALLTRLLILEKADGPTDIQDTHVRRFIEQGQTRDGIGNTSYESSPIAKATLANMRAFYRVFKNDPLVVDGNGMKEFRVEYFIVSFYLLLRHLRTHYVFGEAEAVLFRAFTIEFFERWRARREDDNEMLVFSGHRQQTGGDIEVRHRMVRRMFFEHVQGENVEILTKDARRAFNEAERIAIYRRDDGLCQACLRKGVPESEALVPWAQYDADHVVPHSKGGTTSLDNAQVLCRGHNQTKGAR